MFIFFRLPAALTPPGARLIAGRGDRLARFRWPHRFNSARPFSWNFRMPDRDDLEDFPFFAASIAW
jgi:hypothetical protein